MKIAIFTESLPPLTDGVARTYTRLAEFLNSRGIDFLFISPFVPVEKEPWRGRVLKVPSFPFPLYRHYRVGLANPYRLGPLLERFKPDLIQVAAPTPLGIYGQNYARHRNLPVFSSYHTHFVDYFPFYGFGWAQKAGWDYMKWFYNRGSLTLSPTQDTYSQLIKRDFNGVQIWPRGIDREKFSTRHRDSGFRDQLGLGKEKLLLFVGRMVKEKGLEVLAEAALLLRKRGHPFHLAFAGDGPFKPKMEKRFPRDHFFGFIQGPELSKLYASADLFLFPSPTETFGNVILEAFASGLPVVAVNEGGSVDLIQNHQNGLLARPRDPEDFSDQVEYLLKNPAEARRMGRDALRTATHFDWAAVNGRLLSHYERAVQSSRSSAHTPPSIITSRRKIKAPAVQKNLF